MSKMEGKSARKQSTAAAGTKAAAAKVGPATKPAKAARAAAAKAVRTAAAAPAPAPAPKITGLRTAKDAAKQLAKPKGGKPGSAMANQSAEYVPGELHDAAPAGHELENAKYFHEGTKEYNARVKKGLVTSVKTAVGGENIVVASGAQFVSIKRQAFIGELQKLAVVGASLKAVRDYVATHKPSAKLAEGVTARMAPNAALAAEQGRRKEGAPTAPAAKGKAPQPAKPAPAPKARPAKGGVAIKVLLTSLDGCGIRQDSDRWHKLAWMLKHKPATTADALGKPYHGDKTLDMGSLRGMEKRGHIKLG